MSIILNNKIYSPKSFLEIITHKVYENVSGEKDDKDFILDILFTAGYRTKCFPLKQYDSYNAYDVVLVECMNKEKNKKEYLWFEVPHGFSDDFYYDN